MSLLETKLSKQIESMRCASCDYNVLWALKYNGHQFYCALCYAIQLEKPRAANRKQMPKSAALDAKRKIMQDKKCVDCGLPSAPFCEYSRETTIPPNLFTHCFVMADKEKDTCVRCLNCFILSSRTQDNCKRHLVQLKKLVGLNIALADALAIPRKVPLVSHHLKQLQMLTRKFPPKSKKEPRKEQEDWVWIRTYAS